MDSISPNVTVRRSPRLLSQSANQPRSCSEMDMDTNSISYASKRSANQNSPRSLQVQPCSKRRLQTTALHPRNFVSSPLANDMSDATSCTKSTGVLLPPAAFMSTSNALVDSPQNDRLTHMLCDDLPFTDDNQSKPKTLTKRRSSVNVGRKSLVIRGELNVEGSDGSDGSKGGDGSNGSKGGEEAVGDANHSQSPPRFQMQMCIYKEYCRALRKELQDYENAFQAQRELKRQALRDRTKLAPIPCHITVPALREPVKPATSSADLSRLIKLKTEARIKKLKMECAFEDVQMDNKFQKIKQSVGFGPVESPRCLLARLFSHSP